MGRVADADPCNRVNVGRRHHRGSCVGDFGPDARSWHAHGAVNINCRRRHLVRRGADAESAKPKWRRNRCLSFGVDRCARRVALVHIGAALRGGLRLGVCHRVWRHHDRDWAHSHCTAVASGKAGQTPRSFVAMGSDCQ